MERLLHAGLSNALSATFLALLVACLGRVLSKRPAILHCLWLLVLLKLVTPPLYEIPISWPETLTASSEGAASDAAGSMSPTTAIYLLDSTLRETAAENEPAADLDVVEPETASDTFMIAERARAAIASGGLWLSLHWMPIAATLWLSGTLATLVISVRRIRRFQLLLREARPASDDIQSWVDELSASLGVERPPQVWSIGGKLSPMLWAFFGRPRLIIPIDLWKSLDQRQQGTLLVHELAHLRRGDHRVRIFELAVTALYWWNPVLWWARQALRDVEEQCCDAWVVWAFPEAAKSYAETLLETLDFLDRSEFSEPLLASGFGKVHHLRRRLTMIMSGTTPRLVSFWGALGALSLGALLLPVNATWAQKPESQDEVRIVIKTDDDPTKVANPAEGLAVTGTVVVTDEPGQVGDKTFFFATDPTKAVQDAANGAISFVVKADDTSVSVSADSVDDAIKKIKEQIQTLKQKAPLGNKEKEQQDALLKIAKQLEEIARTSKFGDKATNRLVIRRVENLKTSTTSSEKTDEIKKARARIEKLSSELAAAQEALAKLEGHPFEGLTLFATPGQAGKVSAYSYRVKPKTTNENVNVVIRKKLEGGDAAGADAKTAVIKKLEKAQVRGVVVNPGQDGLATSGTATFRALTRGNADEDRIQALEKKLNKLLEEVASLKKSQGK